MSRLRFSTTRRARLALSLASFALVLSCDENLPSGPVSFAGTVRIVLPKDTLVVGDSSQVSAEATDTQGRKIQSLSFVWTTSDANVLGVVDPAGTAADTTGRTKVFIGRRPGRSNVSLALPDPRFVTTGAARTETVVVGGVRVSTTHDSTLTAIGDTAVAIAAALVRVNGALVTRVSQGITWTHKGDRTTVIGQGDTIRYIARTNGVDTLIASHDFCLAGAKCADTVVARVAQVLTLGLAPRTFAAWSFSDSVGPSVVLADRRGNGLVGTSIRFVPRTTADSSLVRVIGPFGTSNPTTGAMAAPKLVTTGNGTARVEVLGIGPDGVSVVATDSITVTVRQVARRVSVEPLRALMSGIDSIPIRRVSRDARGAAIADATVDIVASGIDVNGIWAGPTVTVVAATGTILPSVSGVALPANNPAAPQVPVFVDPAVFALLAPDSVVAGTTSRTITFNVVDSIGQAAIGRWVRFHASQGNTPDSVQVDAAGFATVVWTPPDIAGMYTLTGLRGTTPAMVTLADSAGRIVLRQSYLVVADVPSATTSTLAISATTIPANGTATVTITLKDRFGNVAKNATPAMFSLTATVGGGTFTNIACLAGVCTATYTAPGAAGPDSVSVTIVGVEILGSPIAITIP